MNELLLKRLIYCTLSIMLLFNVFIINSYAYIGSNPSTVIVNDGGGGSSSSGGNFDLSLYGNDATPSDGTDASSITNPTVIIAGIIISGVRIVGTGVALIMLTVIAIKYLLAAPGDRANLMKTSYQYIVGAIIVFGSAQILGIIVDIFPGLLG